MKIVISDTTCLIHLSKADLLWLLREVYGTVFVTPTVVQEFGEALPDWMLTVQPHTQYLGPIRLDRGEASALALALELRTDCLLLTDDRQARRAAVLAGIDVRGTLGILSLARQRQLLGPLAPLIAQMRQRGLYATNELITQTLRDAGDIWPA